LAAIAGAVDRLAEAYLQPQPQARSQESQEWVDVAGDEVSVVLTGGDAAAISPHLRCRHEIRPHLVCLGLLDLASWQCRHTAGGLK
jgi:type III pantothenate kinase